MKLEILLTKRNLFAFPTEASLRDQWVNAICRLDEWDPDYSAVCELHFRPEDFENGLSPGTGMQRQCRWLKSGAVRPSLQLLRDPAEYVLQGKLQSDRIESQFGHLHKLSGGNYWSSARQILENEAVFRTKGLIWWLGFSPAEAAARMAPSRQERQQEGALVIQELVVEVANSAEVKDLNDSAKASLGHIAGALARSATRHNKCGACDRLLIDQGTAPLQVRLEEGDHQVETVFLSFTALLDRGRLLVPSQTAIDLTMSICQNLRTLLETEASRNHLYCPAINQGEHL